LAVWSSPPWVDARNALIVSNGADFAVALFLDGSPVPLDRDGLPSLALLRRHEHDAPVAVPVLAPVHICATHRQVSSLMACLLQGLSPVSCRSCQHGVRSAESLPPRARERVCCNRSRSDQLPQGDPGRSHAAWRSHPHLVSAVDGVAGNPQGRLIVCPVSAWRACQSWFWSAGLTAPNAWNRTHRRRSGFIVD